MPQLSKEKPFANSINHMFMCIYSTEVFTSSYGALQYTT